MKRIIIVLIGVIILSSCDNSTIGKYKKQPLPADFTYTILKDESDDALGKNQFTIEINKKITIEQIATLADKLYSSKKKQRRFYIFYDLANSKNAPAAWAISHFDPDLEIEIIGSTEDEELNQKQNADKVDGTIIGVFYEQEYTSASYTIYEKNDSTFIKVVFKDGSVMDSKMKKTKMSTGIRLDEIDNTNGEYYVLTDSGKLEFYNKENKNFTTATKTK